MLEEVLEDTLVVLGLPEKHRQSMKSTNMQERLIQEIRRRERVIRIVPIKASAQRLIGALLAERHAFLFDLLNVSPQNWSTR